MNQHHKIRPSSLNRLKFLQTSLVIPMSCSTSMTTNINITNQQNLFIKSNISRISRRPRSNISYLDNSPTISRNNFTSRPQSQTMHVNQEQINYKSVVNFSEQKILNNRLSKAKYKNVIKLPQKVIAPIIRKLPKTHEEFVAYKEEAEFLDQQKQLQFNQTIISAYNKSKISKNNSGNHSSILEGIQGGINNNSKLLGYEKHVQQFLDQKKSLEVLDHENNEKQSQEIVKVDNQYQIDLDIIKFKSIPNLGEIIFKQGGLDRTSQLLFNGKWDKLYEIFELIQSLRNKFLNDPNQIHLNLIEDMTAKKQFDPALEEGQISINDLDTLQRQLSMDLLERDQFVIDRIISKNKFFTRFNEGVRVGIIEQISLIKVTKGTVILELGGQTNCFFVVMRGSCSLTVQYKTLEAEHQIQNVVSFFEGQHFNESTLVQKDQQFLVQDRTDLIFQQFKDHPSFKNKNNDVQKLEIVSSNIVAQEELYYLIMRNDNFQQILINSVEKDIEPKLGVLLQVKSLHNCLPVLLIPLAATISTENFKFGDYLVKKGDEIDRLFIISTGDFKLVIDTRQSRELKNEFFRPKAKPLRFKESIDNDTKRMKSVDYHNQEDMHFFCKPPIADRKSYDKGSKVQVSEDLMEVTKHQAIRQLSVGEVICGRAIFNQDDQYKKSLLFPNFNRSYKNAKMSIVVYSTQASVFSLDYKQFATLPEVLQEQLKQGIIREKEFDDYNINKIEQTNLQWEIIKQAYYKSFAINRNNNRVVI